MTRSALLPALIALACTASLAGCGEDDAKGGKKPTTAGVASGIERQIERGIFSELDLKAKVSCPADAGGKKGEKFTCAADVKGAKDLRVTGEQQDAKGKVSWVLHALLTAPVAAEVGAEIAEQKKVELDLICSPEAVKLEAGTEFVCDATDPQGASYQVPVTVQDDKGNVSWKLRKIA